MIYKDYQFKTLSKNKIMKMKKNLVIFLSIKKEDKNYN